MPLSRSKRPAGGDRHPETDSNFGVNRMHDLVLAARTASLPFETSADGTFVRFVGNSESVYVVRNAWRGGYTVHLMTDGYRTQIGHYDDAAEAVAVAAECLGGAGPARAVSFHGAQARQMAS